MWVLGKVVVMKRSKNAFCRVSSRASGYSLHGLRIVETRQGTKRGRRRLHAAAKSAAKALLLVL